jgi:hypothetical protein
MRRAGQPILIPADDLGRGQHQPDPLGGLLLERGDHHRPLGVVGRAVPVDQRHSDVEGLLVVLDDLDVALHRDTTQRQIAVAGLGKHGGLRHPPQVRRLLRLGVGPGDQHRAAGVGLAERVPERRQVRATARADRGHLDDLLPREVGGNLGGIHPDLGATRHGGGFCLSVRFDSDRPAARFSPGGLPLELTAGRPASAVSDLPQRRQRMR